MMNNEQIIRQEIAIVLALSPADIQPDHPLVEYGLDSVRVMDLVAGIEDLFEIEIEEIEIAGLQTLNDVLAMVEQKTQERV